MKKKLALALIITGCLLASYSPAQTGAQAEKNKMEATRPPYATLGGIKEGIITREELKHVTKVEVNGVDSDMKITEFKLSVVVKSIGYKEFNSHDENLTDGMLAKLQQLPAGSKIYIEYIRAGSGESTRQIAPLSFTVVE
ncbi:hypothetical protein BH11BAC1_BH11BAC1_13290 [soil metagenome]